MSKAIRIRIAMKQTGFQVVFEKNKHIKYFLKFVKQSQGKQLV